MRKITMHESESVSRSSDDLALAEQNSRVSPTLVAVGVVLALVAIVTLTRLHRIADTPPGIINDEGANGVDALRVLKGEHAIFFAERASGREPMAIYATALATRLFGPSLLAFHLPPALASAGTVLAVFWLGLLLFGKDEDSNKLSPCHSCKDETLAAKSRIYSGSLEATQHSKVCRVERRYKLDRRRRRGHNSPSRKIR